MPGAVPGELGPRKGKEKTFEIQAARAPTTPFKFAIWELEDFATRSGLIHGCACDDLVGVATILAVMTELKQTRARVNVVGTPTVEHADTGGATVVFRQGGVASPTPVPGTSEFVESPNPLYSSMDRVVYDL